MFDNAHNFDHLPQYGPNVFVSEYAFTEPSDVNDNDTLIGTIAEATFAIGVERNSDDVSMAIYAPLFMHRDDPKWKPDAINFDSHQAFGIPSYWMQTFFTESSGATLLNVTESTFDNFIASAIRYTSEQDNSTYIKMKVVNFQNNQVNVTISINKVDAKSIKGSKQTVFTSDEPHDYNSFENLTKMIPKSSALEVSGNEFYVILKPYSLTSLDPLDTSQEESESQTQGRKEGLGRSKHN